MSYDLFLYRDVPLNPQEFLSFFERRPHYRVNNGQAFYQNEDTGVYFSFEVSEDADDETRNAAFNLNYYRPHFFGLEAAPEVQAVIEQFQFRIEDPQNGGMGSGPFSAEGFLRGWNQGNEFGYRAVLCSEHAPDSVATKPTTELEASWRWNAARSKIQDDFGQDVFVPRVLWASLDGSVFSAVVWPDGIPTLIPKAELLIVIREELAPRRFFSRTRTKDHCYVTPDRLQGVLEPFDRTSWPLPCRIPRYRSPVPGKIRDFVRGLTSDDRKFEVLSADSVLNQELVERATAG